MESFRSGIYESSHLKALNCVYLGYEEIIYSIQSNGLKNLWMFGLQILI